MVEICSRNKDLEGGKGVFHVVFLFSDLIQSNDSMVL